MTSHPRKHTWGPGYFGGKGPYWTEERVIERIREWTKQHDGPPTYTDWHPAGARRRGDHAQALRFESGDWPSATTVTKVFGSFRAGLAAAGYSRYKRVGPAVPIAEIRRRRSLAVGIGDAALATQIRAVAVAKAMQRPDLLASALDGLAVTAATYAQQLREGTAAALAPSEQQ